MTDHDGAARLLTSLQFGDGQFPGGGFAFSWGLESLAADGQVGRRDFAAFLEGQMRYRWAGFDRVLVAHAHAAFGALDKLQHLDDLAEAMTTAEVARTGSGRAGRALLGTHVRLGTEGAAELRARVDAGAMQGHLPVVQGAVLQAAGLDCAAALAVSAYTAASALATAGIRLGLIGHLDAQRSLIEVRPHLASLADAPPPPLDALQSFVPVADLAMMRHADLPQRLFSN
ncbi:MAG: Urease accessory protein UreF [Rhizobacter sp.]|nr:Urease accessory protein UreF [Rhizobacter sp.]